MAKKEPRRCAADGEACGYRKKEFHGTSLVDRPEDDDYDGRGEGKDEIEGNHAGTMRPAVAHSVSLT
jgi:hypothetical protein